jgi:hypothetical protein
MNPYDPLTRLVFIAWESQNGRVALVTSLSLEKSPLHG